MRTLTLICAAALAVCTGQAQSSVDRISVHFSAPVMIGETMLPAGDCSMQVIRGSSDNVVLEVRSASEPAGGILVQVSRLDHSDAVTSGSATVILSHRNNQYQLNQIVFPDHTGFRVLD
jgi:hypothetical protein